VSAVERVGNLIDDSRRPHHVKASSDDRAEVAAADEPHRDK
jgi:hypothetical protein